MVGHPTLGSGGTPGGGQAAGVPALTTGADLLVTAVSVQQTSGLAHPALAQVTLGTRDVTAALLATGAAHTCLAAGAVLGSGALLGADSVLASVASVTVGALTAGVGEREAASQGVTSRGRGTGTESLVIVH